MVHHQPFAESEVIPDFERSTLIHKRTRYLLKLDLEQLKDKLESQKTIADQLSQVEKDLRDRYETAREFIEERRRKNIIDHPTYKREIASFENIFGNTWDEDLDWSKDWLKTLNERFVCCHPTVKIKGTENVVPPKNNG